MDSHLSWLGRLLQLPAYRCGPCRRKFFSLLRNHHIRPSDEEIPEPPVPPVPKELTPVA